MLGKCVLRLCDAHSFPAISRYLLLESGISAYHWQVMVRCLILLSGGTRRVSLYFKNISSHTLTCETEAASYGKAFDPFADGCNTNGFLLQLAFIRAQSYRLGTLNLGSPPPAVV